MSQRSEKSTLEYISNRMILQKQEQQNNNNKKTTLTLKINKFSLWSKEKDSVVFIRPTPGRCNSHQQDLSFICRILIPIVVFCLPVTMEANTVFIQNLNWTNSARCWTLFSAENWSIKKKNTSSHKYHFFSKSKDYNVKKIIIIINFTNQNNSTYFRKGS